MSAIKVIFTVVLAWHLVVALFVLPTMFTGGQVPNDLKSHPVHQYAAWLQKKAECLK